MSSRHEHHLRIPDDHGGWFLEPHQHVLWVDSTLKDRSFYEQQRGSSKANRIEAELAVKILRRLNVALSARLWDHPPGHRVQWQPGGLGRPVGCWTTGCHARRDACRPV